MVVIMKALKFSTWWKKLDDDEFTTIRGENFHRKIDQDEIVSILVPGHQSFFAKVLSVEQKQIKDIPVDVLIREISSWNLPDISTYSQYLALVNSGNVYGYTFKPESIVTIVKLIKIKGE